MFNDILKSITTIYKKSSTWAKIFFIVLLFLIVITIFKQNKKTEGFIQSDQFLFNNGPLIYDDFYVNIYDHLVYNNIKNQFEIGEIINATKPSEESIILDIGSGPGHHVALLQQLGFKNQPHKSPSFNTATHITATHITATHIRSGERRNEAEFDGLVQCGCRYLKRPEAAKIGNATRMGASRSREHR